MPEVVGGEGEVIAFHDGRPVVAKLDELELVIVGDEAEAVLAKILEHLLGLGEVSEAVAGRLNFDYAALGTLVGRGFCLTLLRYGKEATVRQACSARAGMCDEDDARFKAFADGV